MYQQTGLGQRLNKYINFIFPLIGIIIIALMLSLVWFWETNGRELYFYEEVIVLNQDMIAGTIITEDMISTEKFEIDKIIENAIIDKNEIIGLEAKHFIPKDSQLHPFYFENPNLNLKPNEYVVRIPNEWLASIPNSLRRNDEVLLYITKLTANNTAEENNENITIHEIAIEEELKIGLGNPILRTNVAFVKDSANREIRTISNEDRFDGTSVISEVSLILTKEELQTIEQSINSGGKIIIMHSEGGDDES